MDQPSAYEVRRSEVSLGKGFPENRLGSTAGQAARKATRRPGGGRTSRRRAQRVTLQDVADRAGVSLTTASRVVNDGSRQVGKALADRVHKAVADLGYTANLQARAVATGQSTMIGVALRDISDPYFSSIAAGLIEVADSEAAPGVHDEHGGARGGRARVRRADARPAGAGRGARGQPVGQHRRQVWRCAPSSTRSPGPAAARPASGRTCSGWTRCCRRTGRARRPWPGRSPRSGTGGSPCSPGRARC